MSDLDSFGDGSLTEQQASVFMSKLKDDLLAKPEAASWEGQPIIDIEMPQIGCKWFIQLSWMMEGCIEDIDQEVHDWSAQPDLTRKCWVRTKVDTRTTMHWMLWSEARSMIIKLVKDGFFA